MGWAEGVVGVARGMVWWVWLELWWVGVARGMVGWVWLELWWGGCG